MECIYNCAQEARGIDWPAWVQAIGSIIAIAVAAYIPIKLSAQDRKRMGRERSYKAKSLAFVLRPHIVAASAGISLIRERWEESPKRMGETTAMDPLKIPEALTARLLDLHALGPGGIRIQKAITAIQALKSGIRSQLETWEHRGIWVDQESGHEYDMPDVDVEGLIDNASMATTLAIDALEGILE